MKKVVMNLDDYKGDYCMHCPTEESAKLFLDFLNKNGRKWITNDSYEETYWETFKELTVYSFNEGGYCKLNYYKDRGYEILEIDDFIGDVPVTREEIENRIFKQAKDIFRLYKMYNPDGEYLALAFVAGDDDKNKFAVIANNDYLEYPNLPLEFNKKFTLEDLK